jgi:hypothetical protein
MQQLSTSSVQRQYSNAATQERLECNASAVFVCNYYTRYITIYVYIE